MKQRNRDRQTDRQTNQPRGTGGGRAAVASIFNLEVTFIFRPLLSNEPGYSGPEGVPEKKAGSDRMSGRKREEKEKRKMDRIKKS